MIALLVVASGVILGFVIGEICGWLLVKLQASQLIVETEQTLAYIGRSK